MTSKLVTLVLAVLLVLGGFGHQQADAQGESSPIFFEMDGDIWSYTPATGALEQKSTWGFNERPVMSPDGTRFAYLSLATIAANVLRDNPDVFMPNSNAPMNVWVWDIAADDAVRIADQPANAFINADGYFENVILRRSLAWSPDSTQLAWVEIDRDYGFRFVIYDFPTRTTRILNADIPLPYADVGVIGSQPVRWGSGGIALENAGISETLGGGAGVFEQTISVYDPNSGGLISRAVIGQIDTIVMDWVWLDSGQIALLYPNGIHQVLNPVTGVISSLSGTVEIYNRAAPNNTRLQLFVGKSVSEDTFSWEILWDNGQPQTIFTRGLLYTGWVAVSPSGDSIAFIGDALYVWSDGEQIRVPGTDSLAQDFETGLVWGVSGYRLSGYVVVGECANAPAPRLHIGGRGIVISGLGENVLRDLPGQSAVGSTEIGVIPPNGEFSVLAGPVCASGFYWWQVNYNGQVGWTAEGEAQTYWLEPR